GRAEQRYTVAKPPRPTFGPSMSPTTTGAELTDAAYSKVTPGRVISRSGVMALSARASAVCETRGAVGRPGCRPSHDERTRCEGMIAAFAAACRNCVEVPCRGPRGFSCADTGC